MKVLFGYIMDGKAGGIDRYMLNVYEQQKDINHFDFLTLKIDSELQNYLESNGSKLFCVASAKNPKLQYKQIKEIITENRYDEVYFNISTAIPFAGVKAAHDCKVPKITVHSHSTGYDCDNATKRKAYELIHNICKSFLYKYATDYRACSESAGRWMFPEKIVKSDRFHVIKNTIDTDRFKFNPKKREEMRKDLNLNGRFVIGHVGNFLYVKNHDFIIDIFNEISKKNDNAVLLLVGDGPLEDRIKDRVDVLNLTDRVIFAGRKTNPEDYYQAMDVFVLPSNFEGLGIAAVEAQCAGLPCVMSDKVPKDADIIDSLCRFIPLSKKDEFVKEITQFSENKRIDCSEKIIESGYSLKGEKYVDEK